MRIRVCEHKYLNAALCATRDSVRQQVLQQMVKKRSFNETRARKKLAQCAWLKHVCVNRRTFLLTTGFNASVCHGAMSFSAPTLFPTMTVCKY